jgi:hypothetical protein
VHYLKKNKGRERESNGRGEEKDDYGADTIDTVYYCSAFLLQTSKVYRGKTELIAA